MIISKRIDSVKLIILIVLSLIFNSALAQNGGICRTSSIKYANGVLYTNHGLKNVVDSISVPEIVGYDNVKFNLYKRDIAGLHYSSSHVSSVDIMFKLVHCSIQVTQVMFYDPCQSCASQETSVCIMKTNKSLSFFNDKDIVEYVQKNGKCKKYYGNIHYNTIKKRLLN